MQNLLSKDEFQAFRKKEGDREPNTDAQAYWTVVRRYNLNKGRLIEKVAVSDLTKLVPQTRNPAVRRAIMGFILVHQKDSPGNDSGGSGPRYA